MDLNTRQQLNKADIKVSLDLSHYNRTNNAERVPELILEGYRPMKSKMKEILRYQRTNTLHYLIKAFIELMPLKVPEIIKSTTIKLAQWKRLKKRPITKGQAH